MKRALLLVAALAVTHTGCLTEEVDTSGLTSVDGYESWFRLDLAGDLPGHGRSYRIIYVNDIAQSYPHVGRYPVGTTVVKEVRALEHRDGVPVPGEINYTAVMRKVTLDDDGDAGTGLPLDAGWLFTQLTDTPGTEDQLDLCWASCHRQGGWDGAFLDYGQ